MLVSDGTVSLTSLLTRLTPISNVKNIFSIQIYRLRPAMNPQHPSRMHASCHGWVVVSPSSHLAPSSSRRAFPARRKKRSRHARPKQIQAIYTNMSDRTGHDGRTRHITAAPTAGQKPREFRERRISVISLLEDQQLSVMWSETVGLKSRPVSDQKSILVLFLVL